MKKGAFWLCIIVMTIFLAACGKSEEEKEAGSNAEITLRVALEAREGEAHYNAVKQFASQVEAKTDGKVEVNIFEAGQLGKEKELIESIVKDEDEVDIVIANVDNLKEYEPRVDICEMPFAFTDYREAGAFMESSVQADAESSLGKQNMHVLTHYADGFHYLALKNHGISNAQDVQGLRIGVAQDGKDTLAMKIIGAMTRTVSEGEARADLREERLDGYAGSLESIYNSHLYDDIDYVEVTNHYYSSSCFIIAGSVWNELDEETRNIVKEAAESSADTANGQVQQQENELLKKLESARVRVEHPQLNSFWQKAEPVIRNQISEYGDVAEKLISWKREQGSIN